jgi:hypothetical protein
MQSENLLYAGIGSRNTPEPILDYMRKVACRLAARGYVLRSGAASGADSAFEQGAVAVNGACEIWLPWTGFNGHADTGLYPSDGHHQYASTVHPAWDRLSRGPKSLHARNVGQVLGADLRTPVKFVLCYTPDGCETEEGRTRETGGTATAIVIAARSAIPVFNLANSSSKDRFYQLVLGS